MKTTILVVSPLFPISIEDPQGARRYDATRYTLPDGARPTLEQVQALVGGYVEETRVSPCPRKTVALVNEDGIALGLPRSPFPTLVGHVAFVGEDADEDGGYWTGLSPDQERECLALMGRPTVIEGGELPAGVSR